MHSETPHGDIKDSSTTLALITMLHHVLQRLERKNTFARILLIDFSKAFDHIDQNILLDKCKTIIMCELAEGFFNQDNAEGQTGIHHI